MFPSRRINRAVSLALALVAGPALAGQFDYTLYAGMEHSDNINLSATDPVNQSVLIPGFGFDYVQQGAVLQAHVTGAAEYRDYLDGAYASQKLGELAGLVYWSVLPGRLDFVAQDHASVQPLSTLSSDAPGNQQQTNVLSLGPTLHFNVGSALRGQAELRYINSRASRTTQFDSSRGEAALRLIRDVSPTSQLSLNLESQKVDFDDAGEVNYQRDQAFVRYVRKLAHLDLDAAVGWSRIRFGASGAGSASNPMVRTSIDWHATAQQAFGFSYTRDYSDAAQDLIAMDAPVEYNVRSTAPVGIQTGGAVISGGVYLEKRYDGSYSYSGERFTVSLSPWQRTLHYLEGTQPDEDGRGLAAGVDYRLTQGVTLTAFANYERVDYRQLGRRDTTGNLGVSLRQQLNSHWSWRASLVDRHRGSTDADGRYRAKEIYFGVVYQR